jgi:hypothetical protein
VSAPALWQQSTGVPTGLSQARLALPSRLAPGGLLIALQRRMARSSRQGKGELEVDACMKMKGS